LVWALSFYFPLILQKRQLIFHKGKEKHDHLTNRFVQGHFHFLGITVTFTLSADSLAGSGTGTSDTGKKGSSVLFSYLAVEPVHAVATQLYQGALLVHPVHPSKARKGSTPVLLTGSLAR
jgi:hypothetical protein